MYRVALPTEDFPRMSFHFDCACNQVRSVTGRVLKPVPRPTLEGIRSLIRAATDIAAKIPRTIEDDLYKMPMSYSGSKRQRYIAAADSLTQMPLNRNDGLITMFVKAERFDSSAKVNPDPRAIQFRDARYAVAFAAFLKPIEHHLYLLKGICPGVPPTRNIAKGLNSHERASLLMKKLEAFDDPVILSLDASRFDMHVDVLLLLVIHLVYLSSNPSSYFAYILGFQLKSKCLSKLGLKYVALGKRMSGDMDTANGNCLLMIIMLIAFMNYVLYIHKWDCLDDGDDVLLITERSDSNRVIELVQPEFLNFGHEMKIESIASNIYEVEFCQSQVVQYLPGKFKFVRNWRAVIAKGLCGIRNWSSITYRLRVIRAIGECELILNRHVPILQAWALAVLRNVGRTDDLKYAPEYLLIRTQREKEFSKDIIENPEIDLIARQTFHLAFGVTPERQVELEALLDRWSFDPTADTPPQFDIDVDHWCQISDPVEISRSGYAKDN